MDKETQIRVDQILEDEISKGYRIVDVPEAIQAQLKVAATVDPTVKPFSRLRFLRLTPRRRRQIQEEVMTRYNRDLKNPDLLSNEQLRKINIERGEWSEADEKEIERLSDLQNTQTMQLNASGFEDREEWSKELTKQSEIYLKALDACSKHPDEKAYLKDIFIRWSNYVPASKEEYTTLFAEKQGRTEYEPDVDLGKLFDTSPSLEATDALATVDEVLGRITKLMELIDTRTKLAALVDKRSKIFANSIEARRDQAEEVARVFYSAELLGDGDSSRGPITANYDAMWDLPEGVLQWLIEELVMFIQNIPMTMRDRLEELGFLAQVPKIGTNPVSEDSPETPNSKPDSAPLAETPVSSTASTTPTA